MLRDLSEKIKGTVSRHTFVQRSCFAMFSARAFFFTALLVLVASTSANPVQSPLEQYSTPWINNHSPAFLGCDGLQSASFKDGSYKPKLERVDGGTNACVYKFKPGWPQKGGESVGKTLKSGGDFNNQAGRNEIDTLQRGLDRHEGAAGKMALQYSGIQDDSTEARGNPNELPWLLQGHL
ncbi:hypothetical protein BDM02DRAFT_476885 [Thelephora ganbajun]|uniref:Uncharacterized protein n=1 Tax=Thelephora ganbajun TaxID=370292 RepID=A0ACB6Z7Q0_THEGA|nr:hypothetical protein BDM02DRAFT_476885 [Thelephora ganbajun]